MRRTDQASTTVARATPSRLLVALLCALTLGGVGLALARVASQGITRLARSPLGMSPAEVITAALLAALALVTLALAAQLVAAMLHLHRAAARPDDLCVASPYLSRHVLRLAGMLLGLSVASGATTAQAAGHLPDPGFHAPTDVTTSSPTTPSPTTPSPTTPSDVTPASVTTAPLPHPGFTATRTPVRRQPAAELVTSSPRPERAPSDRSEHVVTRGDTLWGIVRAHLGADATDAEVATALPAWHRANLAVIGPDPDRLLPGQILHAPRRQALLTAATSSNTQTASLGGSR